jgi:regulator of RNase E activity RraA
VRFQPDYDDMVALTAEWQGDRFSDGRPRVPNEVLESLHDASTEHIWATLWKKGYQRQFEGHWCQTHPGRTLVGRAVTAQFIPQRPDHDDAMTAALIASGRETASGRHNWTVVESLQEHDVMVVDIFGKVYEGTVVGDNLGTAVASRTKAGAVIDGGVRDLAGLLQLDDVNFYYRGTDPTPIRDVALAGLNIPVRIGGATVLPGDVVVGTRSGVIFIPPLHARLVADMALETRHRDQFGKTRLKERRYTSQQIDVPDWDSEIEEDFARWRRESADAG